MIAVLALVFTGMTALAASANAVLIPVAPYNYCPSVGSSPSCEILLVIYPDQSITVYQDSSVGPYDGIEDTLVGVWNQSSSSVEAITVNGRNTGLGQLDGDGLCAFAVSGCPFGPTGYEGPNTAIKTSPSRPDSAEIDFPSGLAPGATTYFSLEGQLNVADLTVRQGPLAITGTFGGYWPNPNLYYYYGGAHRYLGNVYQGAANWTNAGTRIHISSWPGVPAPVHIAISDAATGDTFWAITHWASSGTVHDCSACVYTQNSITFIRGTMDPLGDFMRTKVATHEFGHAIGLRHPLEVGLTNTRSVMNQHNLPYNTPQPYDVGLVKELYP
jgi:hypothetical protein